jgi:hypothetical protein
VQLQIELAGLMDSLAYGFDLTGAFADALAAADLAISLAPNEIWRYSNKAHALMFLGRVNEARAIYLQHRGEQSPGHKVWEEAILNDFAELRENGFTRPLMNEIQRLFNKPVSAAE